MKPSTLQSKPIQRKPLKGKARKMLSKAKKNPYTVKAMDTVFSQFIRRSGANGEGIVGCYTCPHKTHYKKMHAGHYISRYYKATRWNENNVKPQCFMCNIYRKGNAVIFRRNLVVEIGEQKVKEMEATTDMLIRGFTDSEDLKALIEIYKQKLTTLTPQ